MLPTTYYNTGTALPTQIAYKLRHNVQKLYTFHDITKEHRDQIGDYARRRVQSGNRIYLD